MGKRIQCMLVGWNSKLLSSCSEASHKKLKKYVSALIILIMLWSFTGYCFAERYLHAPLWGCIVVSAVFVMTVIQIERQIILTVGKAGIATWIRGVIAVLMALLSSAIIDQIIFADDVDKKMIEVRDRQVEEQLPHRLAIIEAKLGELQKNIDSLESFNLELNTQYVRNPTIKSVTSNTEHKTVRQASGADTLISVTNYTRTDVPNPTGKRIERNNETINLFRKQQEEYTAKKLEAEMSLRAEISSKTGFLEELSAIIQIIGGKIEALIFYLILFCFLLLLELFIVFSKMMDKKCDYDEIVEHQLETRINALQAMKNNK